PADIYQNRPQSAQSSQGFSADSARAAVASTHGQTEWILLTSGTTGAPKLLVHTLSTLTAPVGNAPDTAQQSDVVWGTFYDIRRYGGLQIFFRALLGRGSFVLSGPGEPIGDYLMRLAAHGATHVPGAPSPWRRAVMRPDAG